MTHATANLRERPKPDGMESPSRFSLVWLTASVAFFVLAIRQFIAGNELRARIIETGRSLDSVPPTMLSEHPAAGIALVCVAVICVLFAFRLTRIGLWYGPRPSAWRVPFSRLR